MLFMLTCSSLVSYCVCLLFVHCLLQIVFQATLQVPAHHAIACRIDVSTHE